MNQTKKAAAIKYKGIISILIAWILLVFKVNRLLNYGNTY